MKKILLLSDTHSYIDDRILFYAAQADEVWHAGDIGSLSVTERLAAVAPLRAVYGNIDNVQARSTFPLDAKFYCEKMWVWITHIGGYPNKYSPRIKAEIYKSPPDIFISGHSHILKVQWDKKINGMHLNPGACGTHGFHQIRTMLRFVVDKKQIKDLEVIELGPRGKRSKP